MPQLDKTLLARIGLAYASYAPFWIAALAIMWKFGTSSSQSGYIGCLGCLAGMLIAASFVAMVYQFIWTVSKVRQGATRDELSGVIALNVGALLVLDLVLFGGLAILTFPIVGD